MKATQNPTAAILIIGDEILSGRTRDTNMNTIATFLAPMGIEVQEMRVIGDDEAAIIEAVTALRTRVDYVFSTGGIGPTHDDITSDCMAKAFGVALLEHPEALKILGARYGADFNAARRRMARIPEGASLIKNPVSDAPGFQIENVFVMAGVPQIMRAMLDDVAPRLRTGHQVVSATLKITQKGEGHIAEPLSKLADRYPALSIGSYPFGAGTELYGSNLVVRGIEAHEVEAAIKELHHDLVALGIEPERV